MANPFYNAMSRAGRSQQMDPMQIRQQMIQQMQQLRKNPVGFLKNLGYNVPDNLANNPSGMIQHLMQSGQFNQQQMQQYQQMMGGQNGQQNGQGNTNGAR